MKLTYFGTAAAEGFPAFFCNCEYCREARKKRGKNIRSRSQAMVNDDLLIDYPPDTYYHFAENGVEGDLIKYILITHSHNDHLHEKDMVYRADVFSHGRRVEEVRLLSGKGAYDKISALKAIKHIKPELIENYKRYELGEYTVTSLPAKHFKGDDARFYIIEQDKTILYAHDTGYFYDEVFDYFKKSEIVFDLISLDCTYVTLPVSDDSSHMGIENIRRVVKRLREIGSVTDKTTVVINHFSHNGNPDHERLMEYVKEDGFVVSYDGMSVEI
ncbi:MAG: MBL fold metallo-hydrolase [Clostridia bacterium]|nr:MBL fold metallo-hydrolase [Clostridia bacterium]